MKGTSVPKFSINLVELQKASVFTLHSASYLSSPPTPVWHTSPNWEGKVEGKYFLWYYSIIWTDLFSLFHELVHETTWDQGGCQACGRSMTWQHPIVPSLRIWWSQSSVLTRRKWFPVHLGLHLRTYSDPAWQSLARASVTAGASLSNFSVHHCSTAGLKSNGIR